VGRSHRTAPDAPVRLSRENVEVAAVTVEAVVVDLLPSSVVRVKLENETLVLAHAAGATKTNFVRMRPGDRVQVELSPHDPGRGRILKLLK